MSPIYNRNAEFPVGDDAATSALIAWLNRLVTSIPTSGIILCIAALLVCIAGYGLSWGFWTLAQLAKIPIFILRFLGFERPAVCMRRHLIVSQSVASATRLDQLERGTLPFRDESANGSKGTVQGAMCAGPGFVPPPPDGPMTSGRIPEAHTRTNSTSSSYFHPFVYDRLDYRSPGEPFQKEGGPPRMPRK